MLAVAKSISWVASPYARRTSSGSASPPGSATWERGAAQTGATTAHVGARHEPERGRGPTRCRSPSWGSRFGLGEARTSSISWLAGRSWATPPSSVCACSHDDDALSCWRRWPGRSARHHVRADGPSCGSGGPVDRSRHRRSIAEDYASSGVLPPDSEFSRRSLRAARRGRTGVSDEHAARGGFTAGVFVVGLRCRDTVACRTPRWLAHAGAVRVVGERLSGVAVGWSF